MLVRCEHCGSALPEEATKCFVCGNKHEKFVPPPIPISDLDELKSMRKKAERKGKILGKIMPWAIFGSLSLTVASFITMSNTVVTMCSFALFAFCIILWLATINFDREKIRAKKESIRAAQKLPKPDEAEYERRIRDFVNH